jgi:formylglycine-generating enzyme required for sulfatase activity
MKTKLTALLIWLALLVGIQSVFAQPVLGIVPTNNQVILFWPITTNGTNGVLQSTTGLVSPNWLSATDAFPVNYGSQIAVSVTNAPSARFFRLSLVPPTTDGMVLIPAGPFTIGDSLDGLISPTNVYVSAFYMDVYLVTSNLWEGVYTYATSQGYVFNNAGSGKPPYLPEAGYYPVDNVDWFDCVKWCNARSQLAGLTPVYYADAGLTQVFTNGDNGTTVYANWGANGYRLPTEAEWEKAARGGLSGLRFPWGDTISESQANYAPRSGEPYDLGGTQIYGYPYSAWPWTSPVGSFPANSYGLYDMAGNLWEWCWDLYSGSPPTGSAYLGGADPHGPSIIPPFGPRVLRGGVWSGYADLQRTAGRMNLLPGYVADVSGFRCVRGF